MSKILRSLLPALMTLSASVVCAEPPAVKPGSKPNSFEARFHDGRPLKFILKDDQVPLVTPQGRKILVPAADIWRIDFTLNKRVSGDIRKQIESAITDLGSDMFRRREAAAAALSRMGRQAYMALLDATANKDPEIANRAKSLSAKLLDEAQDEELFEELIKHDVIQTAHKKMIGHIDLASLKAQTDPTGALQLSLADLQSVQSLTIDMDAIVKAQPDPGNLAAFKNQVGKILVFKVTGVIGGSVWGTKVYTDDSTLAAAAVHAGVVKPGQTKKVRVKILGPMQAYRGSQQNGVVSADFDAWGGSYQFVR